MSYWLDLAGSYIIGGMVVLMIAMLNTHVVSSSINVTNENIAQGNLKAVKDVINSDFYKIGYWLNSQSIAQADSDKIKFYSDLDNNGIIDTVYYYPGTTSQLTSTKNPNDKPLYRKVNNNLLTLIAATKFKLAYYDSLGRQLDYVSLSSQTQRDFIRSVQVYLKVESSEPNDNVYQGAEWLGKVTPKNL